MSEQMAEIAAAAARVREGERAEARSAALARQIAQESAVLDALAATIDTSVDRVHDLEGHSLRHVIAALRGRSEEELNHARAAVRALQLELSARRTALATLDAERTTSQARAAALPDDRRALDQARTRRVAEILAEGGIDAERLHTLEDRAVILADELHDCDEVASMARIASRALSDCRDRLASAHSWANADTFFHGGMLAASIEHHRIDDATQSISHAQAALQRLAAEIDSLRDPHALLPNISPGLKTANIWFDNIFSDWMVRSRIIASEDSVSTTLRRVEDLIADLVTQRAQIAADLQDLTAQRAAIIGG